MLKISNIEEKKLEQNPIRLRMDELEAKANHTYSEGADWDDVLACLEPQEQEEWKRLNQKLYGEGMIQIWKK